MRAVPENKKVPEKPGGMARLQIAPAPNGWVLTAPYMREGLIPDMIGVYNDINVMLEDIKAFYGKQLVPSPPAPDRLGDKLKRDLMDLMDHGAASGVSVTRSDVYEPHSPVRIPQSKASPKDEEAPQPCKASPKDEEKK